MIEQIKEFKNCPSVPISVAARLAERSDEWIRQLILSGVLQTRPVFGSSFVLLSSLQKYVSQRERVLRLRKPPQSPRFPLS